MGNSDKTDKPAKDQTEADKPKVDEIEDAEIIEEIESTDENSALSEAADEPVEIAEPAAEAVEESVDDADGEPENPDVESSDDTAQDEDVIAEEEAKEPSEGDNTDDELAADQVEREEATVEEKPAETAPAQQPQEETRKGGGFFPLVVGGVVAGAIGFGAAVYLGDQLGFGAKSQEALAALQQQISDQGGQIDALQSAQTDIGGTAGAAQDAAGGNATAIATLTETATALGVQIDGLDQRVLAFETRLTDIEKRPLNEGLSAAAIAAYEREVEDLKDLVAAQKAEASELKDKADLSAKAALARSAVTRIVAALDSGAGYRAAIVDYGSATGGTVPEVLETYADDGVITLAALTESYPENARAALAKARVDKVDEGSGNKLGNFLKNQLGARSVAPKEGESTDAVLSRAEAALREGRLNDVLSELDALAEGPKSVMSEWRAIAETRLAATKAAEELAQSLNTN